MNRIAYRSTAFVFAAVMTLGTLEGIAMLAGSADLAVVVMPTVAVTAQSPQAPVQVALNAH